jgi:ankyrin repeat protein
MWKKLKGKWNAATLSVAERNTKLWNACARSILSSSNNANMMSVQEAIAAGADVNYLHGGISCLCIAAKQVDHEMAGLLLAAGADKDAKVQEGFTALIIAAQNGNDKIVELLLTAGVDKEAKKQDGLTALIIAAYNGRVKCVEVLLTAGADKEAKT